VSPSSEIQNISKSSKLTSSSDNIPIIANLIDSTNSNNNTTTTSSTDDNPNNNNNINTTTTMTNTNLNQSNPISIPSIHSPTQQKRIPIGHSLSTPPSSPRGKNSPLVFRLSGSNQNNQSNSNESSSITTNTPNIVITNSNTTT
jgi:hypothetical protein